MTALPDTPTVKNAQVALATCFEECARLLAVLEDEVVPLAERQALGPEFLEAVGPLMQAVDDDIATLKVRPTHVHLGSVTIEMRGANFTMALLKTAIASGQPAAISWLRRVLLKTIYRARCHVELRGMEVEEDVALVNGIVFRRAPDFGTYPSMEADLAARSSPFSNPVRTIATIAGDDLPLYEFEGQKFDDGFQRLEGPLQRAMLGLNMFGPRAVPSNSWRERDDPDLIHMDSSKSYGAADQFDRVIWPGSIRFGADQATLIDRYLGISGKFGARLDLALRRLRSAYTRLDDEDQLVDLAIVFEALLGTEKNELTFRYSIRCALLIGGSLEERAQTRQFMTTMYDMRSAIVHGAAAKGDLRVTVRSAIAYATILIQRLVLLGREPDWSTLELGGPLAT